MTSRRALLCAPLVALVALLAIGLLSCGDEERRAAPVPPPSGAAVREPAPSAEPRLPLGITEFNAQLLRPPGAPGRPGLPAAPAEFEPVRERVAALAPRYVRVVVDWLRVGADPSGRPDLELAQNGCVRDLPPCAAFGGLRAQLEAVREQQRRGPGWEVVVVVAWTPAWAARGPEGCERPGTDPRARPITPAGLRAYRAMLRAVAALGRDVGVPLRWWSPFNEANHPSFVSPQRAACDTTSPTLAPARYAEIVRAARAELAALGGDRRLVLGELAGFRRPTPRSTGVAEFVRALPDDVACDGAVWAQHMYVRPDGAQHDAVGELARALDERPCTAGRPIWVTETGVGGTPPGRPRPSDDGALRAQCRAMHEQLRRWDADPRVGAVFQYTVRDDPFYAVALHDPGLTRAWPVADAWAAWGRARSPDPPPGVPASCA